jgi:hypothetical protein
MRRLLPLLSVLLLGCPDDPDEVAATDFEGQLADDIEALAFLMSTIDEAAVALPDQADAVQEQQCHGLLGACERCIDYDGTQTAGSWTSAPEFDDDGECSFSGATALLAATYSLSSEDLTGSWAGTIEEYALVLEGQRAAELTVNTPKFGVRTYDASWVIDEATATTDDSDIDAYQVDLEYPAFYDQFWAVSFEGNEFSVRGTATGNGWDCDISGSPTSTDVTCTE